MTVREISPTPATNLGRAGGRAGALAALLVLFLDLLWRATIAPAGVASIPDTVVAAVARLTPLALFGWATENFDAAAQNTLWAIVLIGIVLVGYWAGQVAGALAGSDMLGTAPRARAIAAAIMGVVLFLFMTVVVFPIAREGLFGAVSAYQAPLLVQAVLFAAGWAIAWAAFAPASVMAATATAPVAGEPVTRRAALGTAAGAALAAGIAVLGWRLAKSPDRGDVAAEQQAAADIAARARVERPNDESRFAAQAATPEAAAGQETIFETLEAEGKLTPVITSVADFYHVSKNISDPVVDGSSWQLAIDGLVGKPLTLSYDDLMARKRVRNITTLSGITNELNGDLAGTAEWSGIPLRELLEEARIDPTTVDVVFHAADGYDDSIPFATAMDPNTLLVTGMNGQPLPPDHGFPARIIVPPIYGMKNVKWVQKIEPVNQNYMGYWQTRGWSDTALYQIWGRIDTPASGEQLSPGPAVIAGVAAAGNRGILRVEISLDEGQSWADAELEPSINPNFTWVRWAFPFDAAAGIYKMLMRATDGQGMVAPSDDNPPLPNGATGWPARTIRVA
jgi:DMSO/TMAO reductase YedYZ molybdopterin-dependent catalytic subunit